MSKSLNLTLKCTTLAAALGAALLFHGAVQAADPGQPGQGVSVQPIKSSVAEETFQTELVMQALKDLGYDVQPFKEIEYAAGHVALGNGDATFMADHWDPLHGDFYSKAGGDAKLYRQGVYSPGALQGYLIDKKTADQYKITKISQLSNPKLAKLFDTDGDGKADLAGCNPGWGCEKVIEHHLDAYKLRGTISHKQGSYAAIIADTIARAKAGEPVLYYTWTPYWVSGVLVPGKDVVWLQVPFSALPGQRKSVSTKLPSGANYGFQANNQRIVANKAFAQANPAAAKLFTLMQLSANDISAQNMRMRDGEKDAADISRHVQAWIQGHQRTYDGWLAAARAAAATPAQ